MSLGLIDLFKDELHAADLINKMYRNPQPPGLLEPCQHQSAQYATLSPQAKEITDIAETILQRQFDALLNPYHINHRITSLDLLGEDPQLTLEGSMRAFILARATTFMISSLGKCSYRACYASLLLARNLPEQSGVHVVSAPSKDQFFVQFKINDKWFIYDPLTNPEIVLPFEIYQKEVFTKFPNAKKIGHKFKLRISKEFSDEFFRKSPALLDKIYKQFLTVWLKPEELLNERQFRICLEAGGISSENLGSKINMALDLLRNQLS